MCMTQEAQLSTLTHDECKKFGKSMKAAPNIELCAGRKEKKKDKKIFKKEGQNRFKLVKKRTAAIDDGFTLGKKT